MPGDVILSAGKALLFFAVPLALAVWELWRLRWERRRDEQAGDRGGSPAGRERT